MSELVFDLGDLVSSDRSGLRRTLRRWRLSRVFGRLPELRRRALLDAVGAEVESQTRRRIAEEKTSPEGEPWPDWSPAYAARRPTKGGLLELDGHLLDSITFEASTNTVSVGSNLVYAGVHQEGHNGIPPRPYLGMSRENTQDTLAVVLDWIEQELRR